MADSKLPGTRQTEEVILGKKFQGETFVTVKSAAQVEEVAKLHETYAHEHAVPIEAYFSIRGHNEPHMRSMLLAYTQVRKATVEAFDDIFHLFFHTTPKPPKAAPEADAPTATEPAKEV